MVLTSVVLGVGLALLGGYLVRNGSPLAREEQELLDPKGRWSPPRFRGWSIRVGGWFLLALGVAVLTTPVVRVLS